ncbi:glucose-6-phosphate isomerase [Desulfosporosinus sp. FKA]|uniref:glucose-6-phosphate isomerase n=1 Tax=Desulfosporosinus sp. FKA TaxID=1969834 RepID=UPI000B49E4FD|nr:glucose-6-phosphate isomerase [Desulfosporosinus sp. FKA]
MNVKLDYSRVSQFISQQEIIDSIEKHRPLIEKVLEASTEDKDNLGWVDLDLLANTSLIQQIQAKAREIREKADVFVLIGVGGSNQGSRAVIESLGDNNVEIIYAGNNLSPHHMNRVMAKLSDKSVYINVIAKNFATLEPGITFRVLRNYLEQRYGEAEAAKRIIATASLNNSSLEVLGKEKGYTLLPFPLDVGGRFSVLSAVGLLPIAVAGINITELLQGANDIKREIQSLSPEDNPAVLYGVTRNSLLQKGYNLEILAFFEPLLSYFSKWWIQLFGESEGKHGKGIYPTACSFTEDLHSLGQYIQEGQRMLFETFLNLENQGSSFKIPHEETDNDGFQYIDSKDFTFLNKTAYEATVKAHVEGGVPCLVLNIPELTAYYMGQLFYFFQYACYISASLLGVDPFNQPGVEAYKNVMFSSLKTI